MTEVDFSRLLSELSKTADALNRESDAVTKLIERFEDKLRKLNIGLEVWLDRSSIRSDSIQESDLGPDASLEIKLGFSRQFGTDWHLVVREEIWDLVYDTETPEFEREWKLVRFNGRPKRLLDASRMDRIGALEKFPELLEAMGDAASDALEAIERAKKFVS